MCFAGSVLWTLTSESFFICHCLIPWHYDYCNFICDKTVQQVRLYIRNSCQQQSALWDRSVMGFIMFTHTLFLSISSLLLTACMFCVSPCSIWTVGRGAVLFFWFSALTLTVKHFLIRKLLDGVSQRPRCWRSIWLWIGYVFSQVLSAPLPLRMWKKLLHPWTSSSVATTPAGCEM